MKATFRTILALALTAGLFCMACQKEENVIFEDFSIPTNDEITALHFWNDQHILAVGGETWKRGIRAYAEDGGRSWKVDSIRDKKLYSVSSSLGGLTVGMGIGFVLYKFNFEAVEAIEIPHPGDFKFIRSISIFNDTLSMAVHGLGIGQIFKIHPATGDYEQVLELDRELNAIVHLDEHRWFASGFGIVLKTNDAGIHWDTLSLFGDQFIAMEVSADSSIVILGISGTVYQSVDQGIHFRKIRSAGIISANPLFTSISFKNKMEGYIGGEGSLLMRTIDGGKTWIHQTGIPHFDIRSILFAGGHFWICGSNGRVLKIQN